MHKEERTRGTHRLASTIQGSGQCCTNDGKRSQENASLLCQPGAKGPRSKLQLHGKTGASTGTCKHKAKKLWEFGIYYRPKVSVKGQVLADFIIERPEEEGQDDS
ncbi:hypothetical protein Tco_1250709, partial [Tanacetum coccineum]